MDLFAHFVREVFNWQTKQGHDKWHDVGKKTTVFNQSVEFLNDLDHTDVLDQG